MLVTRIIRYCDFQEYMRLIQYISTKDHISKSDFNKFYCNKNELIILIFDKRMDNSEYLCMSVKINYLFKFSKQMSYDMIIQDLIYDPNYSFSLTDACESFVDWYNKHEDDNDINVDKRVAFNNHLSVPFQSILKNITFV